MTIERPMLPPRAEFVLAFPAQPAVDHPQFSALADAEAFLRSQGFWLIADSCNWTNAAGDNAGCYPVEGRYGTVKAWRVVINQRSFHHHRPNDDELGMQWWNNLSEQERRHWLRVAQSARAVDAWNAFKGARLSERELTPRDVLIELFEEELLQYPDLLADLVIARLGVKGFEIRPVDYNKQEG